MSQNSKVDRFSELKTLLYFIGILWIVYFVSLSLPLLQYGITPRTKIGLLGVVTSPFLHANLQHLTLNSTGLFAFGVIFILLEGKNLLKTFAFFAVVGGSLTWLFALGGVHVGASGVIFGIFGYLVSIGFFHKRFKYILVSLLVIFFYGTMVFGILPTAGRISWEGHLFGFISGLIGAKVRF